MNWIVSAFHELWCEKVRTCYISVLCTSLQLKCCEVLLECLFSLSRASEVTLDWSYREVISFLSSKSDCRIICMYVWGLWVTLISHLPVGVVSRQFGSHTCFHSSWMSVCPHYLPPGFDTYLSRSSRFLSSKLFNGQLMHASRVDL